MTRDYETRQVHLPEHQRPQDHEFGGGGAVIAFDELNHSAWPGETMALLDTLGIRSRRLERFPFQPQLSFAVLD